MHDSQPRGMLYCQTRQHNWGRFCQILQQNACMKQPGPQRACLHPTQSHRALHRTASHNSPIIFRTVHHIRPTSHHQPHLLYTCRLDDGMTATWELCESDYYTRVNVGDTEPPTSTRKLMSLVDEPPTSGAQSSTQKLQHDRPHLLA